MSVKQPTVSKNPELIKDNPVIDAQYTFKSVNGSRITYNRGDNVTSQGRFYKCLKPTTQSPLQNKSNWALTGMSETFKGSVPPIKPLENQLWMADTGKLYIWYKDISGFQWVQI
jgi:hypothetical protein